MQVKNNNVVKKMVIAVLAIMFFIVSVIVGLQTVKAEAASNKVIKLSIYALYGDGNDSSSSSSGLGHAWLIVENGTNSSYSFYNTTLSAGETFSIGTWGNRKDPDTNAIHYGAWLNLEAYSQMSSNTASLTITINSTQLATVSQKCISMNSWNIFGNCSYFASEIWNAIAPSSMKVNSFFFPSNFPSVLKESIMTISGYQTNREFAYNNYTGYCTNSTTFKYIKASRILSSSTSSSSSLLTNECNTSFPEEYTIEEIQNSYV